MTWTIICCAFIGGVVASILAGVFVMEGCVATVSNFVKVILSAEDNWIIRIVLIQKGDLFVASVILSAAALLFALLYGLSTIVSFHAHGSGFFDFVNSLIALIALALLLVFIIVVLAVLFFIIAANSTGPNSGGNQPQGGAGHDSNANDRSVSSSNVNGKAVDKKGTQTTNNTSNGNTKVVGDNLKFRQRVLSDESTLDESRPSPREREAQQVSSGIRDELSGIQESFKQLGSDHKPKVTLVVGQKRHHTRFFPMSQQAACGKAMNVRPGTVVDGGITNVEQFEFYPCSHFGIQGTSRPIRYHMLYNHSHLYARRTRTVCIPAPIYYADLIGFSSDRFRIGCIGIRIESSTVADGLRLQNVFVVNVLNFYCYIVRELVMFIFTI